MTQPIAPCLWFDGNAEDAVNYYVWRRTHGGILIAAPRDWLAAQPG